MSRFDVALSANPQVGQNARGQFEFFNAVLGAHGTYTFLSSTDAVLGCDSNTLIAESLLEFIHPKDLRRVRGVLNAAGSDNRTHQVRYRHRRVDGSYCWLESLFCGSKVGQDVYISVISFAIPTPTTQREAASASSSASCIEQPLILTFDHHGNIRAFNEVCERYTGYKSKEVIGRHISAVFPIEHTEILRLLSGKSKNNKESSENNIKMNAQLFGPMGITGAAFVICPLEGKDGFQYALSGFDPVSVYVDTVGQVDHGGTLISTDVERYRARLAAFADLVDSLVHVSQFQDRLDCVVRAVPRGIPGSKGATLLLRHDERLVFSATLPDKVSLSMEEIQEVAQLVVDRQEPLVGEAKFAPFVEREAYIGVPLIADRAVLGVLFAFGEMFYGDVSADLGFLRLIADQATMVVVCARSVERIQTLERVLETQNQELAQFREFEDVARRLRGRLIANVSHEFRTPLGAVLGFSELLLDGAAGPLQDKAREYVHHIAASGVRLMSMANEAIDLLSGLEHLNFERADIDALLRSCALRAQQSYRGVGLELELSAGIARVDIYRLEEALRHLLLHVLKSGPMNGHVRVLARQLLRQDTRQPLGVEITISNPLASMCMAEWTCSFEQMLSGGEPSSSAHLPIAVSRHIVELHGGTIYVDAETGAEGVNLRIWLPEPMAG